MRLSIRKAALAALAVATIAGSVLVSSQPSEARGRHGGWHRGHHHHHAGRVWVGPRHHHHWRRGFHRPVHAWGPCVVKKRWVRTPWGPAIRRVRVCY